MFLFIGYTDKASILYDDLVQHDYIMTAEYFPHYWPFVWWIHLPLVDSPHKGPLKYIFDVSLFFR